MDTSTTLDQMQIPELTTEELESLRREGRVGEMLDTVAATLVRCGVDEAHARDMAARVVLDLLLVVGGSYMPAHSVAANAVRNALLWRDFNGHNIQELQRRYGVCTRHVYNILERQREIHRRRTQGTLDLD